MFIIELIAPYISTTDNIGEGEYWRLYDSKNKGAGLLIKKKCKNTQIMKTYNVVFHDDQDSNDKGFKYSKEDAIGYVDSYNGTNESYFEDYKGGTVQVVCNETEEVVHETEIL
jgi:hypothetical protein